MLNGKELFVRVGVFFLHFKFVGFVHAFNIALRPDTLVKVSSEFGARGSKPPKEVNAHGAFHVVEKVLLLAVLLLHVVDVALVVVDGGYLLRQQVKGEVGKEQAFHKRQDASDERIWVVLKEKPV